MDRELAQQPQPPEVDVGGPILSQWDLHCLRCGYKLTGLFERRCPECGRQFDPRENWEFDRRAEQRAKAAPSIVQVAAPVLIFSPAILALGLSGYYFAPVLLAWGVCEWFFSRRGWKRAPMRVVMGLLLAAAFWVTLVWPLLVTCLGP